MEVWQDLMNVAERGVLVKENTSGGLRQELAHGNHRSARKYEGEVLRTAMTNVALSRAMVFKAEEVERTDGLHVSPVGVVEAKEKIRVIHDLTFERPRRGAGGKPRRSLNVDTDREQVPGCKRDGVLNAILKCVFGLREVQVRGRLTDPYPEDGC